MVLLGLLHLVDAISERLGRIAERMHVEEALRESEEKYRDLFNNARVGVFWSRISDGRLLACNDLFARLVGYDNREECLADYVFSDHYVDPDARNRMLTAIRERGEIQNFEAQLTRGSGHSSPVFASCRGVPCHMNKLCDKDIAFCKRT